jgi:hypothetical protein
MSLLVLYILQKTVPTTTPRCQKPNIRGGEEVLISTVYNEQLEVTLNFNKNIHCLQNANKKLSTVSRIYSIVTTDTISIIDYNYNYTKIGSGRIIDTSCITSVSKSVPALYELKRTVENIIIN